MPKAMIGPAPLANLDGEFLHVFKRAGFELVFPAKQVQMMEDDLLAQLGGISATLAGSEPYTRKVFEKFPDLKVIARAGVGYDAVDVAAATDHGVVVCIAPGTNQDSVAEHTFMLILCLARNLISQHNGIVGGKWPRVANLPLRGRTLGVVGLGRIGKAVSMRGLDFGMKVVAYEPYPDKAFVEKHGIKLATLEDVLKQGDYVSLHLPAMAETRHLITHKTLALMKPTAFLINTARGAVVDEKALYDVLKDKKIAGAGIDVFDQEPPDPNHPIIKLDNVVITAHTAGVDLQSRDEMALLASQCIARLSQGEWPAECIVNPEVKGKFKWKGPYRGGLRTRPVAFSRPRGAYATPLEIRSPHGTKSLSFVSSPPATVMYFRKFSSLIPFLRKRTEASPKPTLNGPSKMPPRAGSGFFGSTSMSAGLLQGTASPASTTMNVFDKPSATPLSLSFFAPITVPGPLND
ncbi:MAG: phosphoglycerate dehydrogenase [Planctomycetes bacterium]|nr:phosphoglycerate dehydrogenase [Planctomycetota bacterium]